MESFELSTLVMTFLAFVISASAFQFLGNRKLVGFALVVAFSAMLTFLLFFFYHQKSSVWLTDTIADGLNVHWWPTVGSAAMGAALALPWCFFLNWISTQSAVRQIIGAVLLVAAVAGIALGFSTFLHDELNDIQLIQARMLVDDLKLEEIAEFDSQPIRVAVDDEGKAYVTYYNAGDDGLTDGGVLVVDTDLQNRKTSHPALAASSPLLMRPFGIAVRDGDIYVSRSGMHTSSKNGVISHSNLGAVTRLSDNDADGIYEFMHDVVTDLPGARGPDIQHQNNGLAFDEVGNLYMAIGTNDDQAFDDHPWGGTVLKASPDFQDIEIIARGLRNPFGLTVGPDELVFVTDNDVRSNAGDEINHIVKGRHYGHPFVNAKHLGMSNATEGASVDPTKRFIDPLYVAPKNANLCGIAYLNSDKYPEKYRDSIVVLNRPFDYVVIFKLKRDGNEIQLGEPLSIARIPTPVDVCCTSSGDIYILSLVYKRLYRIRPV